MSTLREAIIEKGFCCSILNKVKVDSGTGCWNWDGRLSKEGYGIWYDPIKGRAIGSHRLSYLMFKNPSEEFYQTRSFCIDHLCRNRACSNPDHLELVTFSENTSRGDTHKGKTFPHLHKEYCHNGHPRFGSNLQVTKDGIRICRKCRNLRKTEYRRRKRNADT